MVRRRPSGNSLECSVCGKVFKFLSQIRRHCEAQHMDLSFPCPICEVTLRSEFYRQKHVKKRHGISMKTSEIRDMEMESKRLNL